MSRCLIALAILLSLMNVKAAADEAPGRSFIALAYHNVEDHDPDQAFVGVSTDRLIAQLGWLQRNGYQPVSIDALLAAREGRATLPDKAVLLTFDDGFESFYTRVYPILKAFQFPAVLGLVGIWMEGPTNATVFYAEDKTAAARDQSVKFGDLKVNRDLFLTWDQVREMTGSGLVEIASHSYDAHHGSPANPQGNSEPAVTTRRFDPFTGAYESNGREREALEADTATMALKIQRETGRRPRVMVWPYGEHSGQAISIATASGMPITLSLADGAATVDRLDAVPRMLITPDPSLTEFVTELRTLSDVTPVRVAQVDLDYVYDPDPDQQERNIGRLVQRVYDMRISTIFLQAFADPEGTGLARQVYFPNSQMPMRADLFNRVSWQLRTRSRVKVFAWMPVLSFDFGDGATPVLAWDPSRVAAPDPKAYRRLSPFDAGAREKILTLYEELARAAPFEGLLFHDDAALSDFEDASPAALLAYAKAGLPASIGAIRADPVLAGRWARLKTDTLIDFTMSLTERARRHRAPLQTARNLFARPVLDPASEAWFAQDLDRFLATYDYTAIMAMPLLEKVPPAAADAWLRHLVSIVASRPQGLRRTIFELQAVDWRAPTAGGDVPIPTETLAGQMRLLLRSGALNFGYYPDDFITDHPNARLLHRDFSLQSYPVLR